MATLVAAFVTFAAHLTVIALLAGLAAVNIGGRVIADIDRSPTLFSGRNGVLAATAAGGLAAGLAACILASWVVATF